MKRQKWMAILIVITIACMMLPMIALAAGSEASADGVECATLAEAIAKGGNVKLLKNVEVNSVITVTKPVILDLGDYIITNNVQKDRPFHVNADSFVVNANNGGMVIPETNTGAYGFIKCVAVKNFTVNGGVYTGNTDRGAFFKLYKDCDGARVALNNVNATSNGEVINNGNTFQKIDVAVNGGIYNVGTRAFYFDVIDCQTSPIIFEGVKIKADCGPCIELAGGSSTFSNCEFTVTGDYTGGYTWARAAIGLGYDANATIKSGTYTAKSSSMNANEGYGAYIYSSGGTLTVEGGAFSGSTASLKADVGTNYKNPAEIIVKGGTFDGELLTTKTGLESITITGGEFTGLTNKTLSGGNNLNISGGLFSSPIPENLISDSVKTVIQRSSGNTPFAIGASAESVLQSIQQGETITLIKSEPTIVLPEGVKVKNETGTDVTVNGNVLSNGELATVDHSISKIDAVSPSCTQEGNVEYWYCSTCGKYYSTVDCTKEITLAETVLAKTAHNYKDGQCTACGAADPGYVAPGQAASTPPKTGDDSHMTLWVALLVLSAVGTLGAAVYGKKRRYNQ